jgi:hypothetical protein
MKKTLCLLLTGLALILLQVQIQAGSQDEGAAAARHYPIHSWDRPRPPIVDPGTASTQEQPGKPPSDAIVLFDGKDLSAWRATDGGAAKWVIKDAAMESVRGSGYVRTLRAFGDCQLHIEWATPSRVEGRSQGRGNSGVFLMGLYEVQVLDSFDNDTYPDGQAAAVYGQYPPQVNASRGPGQWQSYDIIFHRPHFDADGKLVRPARMTVLHNGVLVQDNVEVLGPTTWMNRPPYKAHGDRLPLALQDHGNPVRFRNVWIRELPARSTEDRDKDLEIALGPAQLDAYVGQYRSNGLRIEITKEGDTLMAQFAGGPSRPIYPRTETLFFSKQVGIEFEFTRGADGVAQEVLIKHGPDRIGPAKRAQ